MLSVRLSHVASPTQQAAPAQDDELPTLSLLHIVDTAGTMNTDLETGETLGELETAKSSPYYLKPFPKQGRRKSALVSVKHVLQQSHGRANGEPFASLGMNDLIVIGNDISNDFLAAITGQPTGDGVKHYENREAQIYLLYLKITLSRLASSLFDDLISYNGSSTLDRFDKLLQIMTYIASIVSAKPKVSVESIGNSLQASGHIRIGEEDVELDKRRAQQLIFCLTGYMHFMYLPVWDNPQPLNPKSPFCINTELAGCLMQPSQPIEIAQRPLQQCRLRFGPILPHFKFARRAYDECRGILYVTNLNAATLHVIGDIKIQWVHTLSSHLDFNEATYTLSLFYLPSFCVLNATSDDAFCARILKNLEQIDSWSDIQADLKCSEYLKEILTSYRLIFADDPAACSLYRSTYKKKAKKLNGFRDPLLDHLCGLHKKQKWSWRSAFAVSHGEYTIERDFPIFGARLLHLQSYIVKRTPRSIWSLWKDKRDLNRWVTLWAATFLGIIGLAFTTVQIVLGALQVKYAQAAIPNNP